MRIKIDPAAAVQDGHGLWIGLCAADLEKVYQAGKMMDFSNLLQALDPKLRAQLWAKLETMFGDLVKLG